MLKQFWVKCLEVRPLTLGAAGGSFSAIAWKLLVEALQPGPASTFDCPVCEDCPIIDFSNIHFGSLDLFSVLIGLLIGVLAGPVIDLVLVIRATWRWWVRGRLRDLAQRGGELYRLA